MSEIFEVEDVKTEFLQKVSVGYSQAFAPKQLELALYVLNDFCNSLTSSGLVLLRQSPQYQAPPQYQQMPFQQQPTQPQLMQGDPFQKEELMQQRIQQNVIEMNNSLKRPRANRGPLNNDLPSVPAVEQYINDDVNLASQKPKSFVDGLKAMRSSRKSAKSDDDDDE